MNALATRPPSMPLGALRDDGTLDPAHEPLPVELAVALYEHMCLARTVDERLVALQRDGVVSAHTSAVGEEAAIIGAAAALGDEDWVFPSGREFAAALWRGVPLDVYAQHALGTARGPSRGRAGPDAPFSRAARVACVGALAGTQIPHAVGVAWAARLRGAAQVALVFFGDGATSTGDFHVGLNFAGVTRAPVVALCRNDGWAMTTPLARQTASAGIAIKALAYGLHGVRVDGADVVAVLAAVREARRRALDGEGGTLVEAVIPRAAEVDPLARFRRHLEARGLWGPEREARLAGEIGADVARAIAEAMGAPGPARASLFDDVYADTPWHLREQREAPAA
ncbi:MAG: thiamine pyrophosphate-dependent dehydrogenase E1 component subunit alpha [Myxococcales bacterium]|nr:thiamine pyrophosphate-dependent dehydrogenase E1 component subunit alpha [Myxococcales bacterium]